MTERNNYTVRRVPRDESGRLELLATRPPLWEYLLLANVLYTSRAAHEVRWRDYELGYTLRVGSVVEARELPSIVNERFSHATSIAKNLERILDPATQEKAFGKPGEAGDSALIEHMAKRLIDLYSLLLGWAEETRAMRVPEWADRLQQLLIAFGDQPLRRTHDFVDEFITRLELSIANLAEGKSNFEHIEIKLTFSVPDGLLKEFRKELKRIQRYLR